MRPASLAQAGPLLPRLLLALGNVFTANMTGNVVLLGFAAAGTSGLSVTRSGTALAAFSAGAAVGGRMAVRLGEGAVGSRPAAGA